MTHSTQMQNDLDNLNLKFVKPIDQDTYLLTLLALIMLKNDFENDQFSNPFHHGIWTNGYGYIVGPDMASCMPFSALITKYCQCISQYDVKHKYLNCEKLKGMELFNKYFELKEQEDSRDKKKRVPVLYLKKKFFGEGGVIQFVEKGNIRTIPPNLSSAVGSMSFAAMAARTVPPNNDAVTVQAKVAGAPKNPDKEAAPDPIKVPAAPKNFVIKDEAALNKVAIDIRSNKEIISKLNGINEAEKYIRECKEKLNNDILLDPNYLLILDEELRSLRTKFTDQSAEIAAKSAELVAKTAELAAKSAELDIKKAEVDKLLVAAAAPVVKIDKKKKASPSFDLDQVILEQKVKDLEKKISELENNGASNANEKDESSGSCESTSNKKDWNFMMEEDD